MIYKLSIVSSVFRATGFAVAVSAVFCSLAVAECDPSKPQPQADCYPLGHETTVNNPADQVNIGAPEEMQSGACSAALEAAQYEAEYAYQLWQSASEAHDNALDYAARLKRRCGSRCRGM